MSATIASSVLCAAYVSMLHEPACTNSATRMLAGRTVLHRTLSRVGRVSKLDRSIVICWDDQFDAVRIEARVIEADVHSLGPRRPMPALDAVAIARRWSDGWRGNLLGTCAFDRGFDARALAALARQHSITLAAIVDPASALLDSELVAAAIDQSLELENQPIIFSAATPGANAPILKDSFINTLESASAHPGMLVTYRPDRPILDPTGSPACQRVPPRVSRTRCSLLVESDRAVRRIESVLSPTEIDTFNAERAIARLEAQSSIDDFPRDVLLEINTNRLSSPIDHPRDIVREPISLKTVDLVTKEIGRIDDIRLTLRGLGDPIVHPQFADMVRCARQNGVRAIAVETDLLSADDSVVASLADLEIDVIAIRIPASSPVIYQHMMGVDGFATVLNNVRQLVMHRGARGTMLPVVVPVFVKTRDNFHEMEVWYDQWITVLGSASIRGPSDFGGTIANLEVADMRPPCRGSCSRLSSRISILCDGQIVPCEEDILGQQAIGRIGETTVAGAWRSLDALRAAHCDGSVLHLPVCGNCRQWHRP